MQTKAMLPTLGNNFLIASHYYRSPGFPLVVSSLSLSVSVYIPSVYSTFIFLNLLAVCSLLQPRQSVDS